MTTMSALKFFWPNIFCLKITNTFLFCYFNIYSNKNLSNLKGLKIEDTQKHKIVTDTGYSKGEKVKARVTLYFTYKYLEMQFFLPFLLDETMAILFTF